MLRTIVCLSLACCLSVFAGDPLVQTRKTAGQTSLALGDGAPFFQTAETLIEARLLGKTADRRRALVWLTEDASGQRTTRFAVLSAGKLSRIRVAAYPIQLLAGAFDPLQDVPQTDLPGQEGYDGRLFVVQYHTAALPEYGDTVRRLGGDIVHFLPNYAAVVRLDPAARSALAAQDFVRWIGPYQPAWRLEPFLRDNLTDAGTVFPRLRYNILLTGESSVLRTDLFPRLEALGGLQPERRGKNLIAVTLTHEQLFQVAAMDEVLFIDRFSDYSADMDIVREVFGADELETVTGYSGQGVRGEAFDLGFNMNHVDFGSRPLITHTSVSSHYHGAAVSGICFGDGTGDPSARGLLPMGQGIVANASQVFSGRARYDHAGELLDPPYEAVFQTSSVGSDRTLHYTNISAEIDTMLFDWDILHCQSQSNAKTRFSRPEAWAKNVVSGGAFRHHNTATLADDCWDCSESVGGASIGPAEDGRIKPDLAAFYDSTYTVDEGGTTAYQQFGGTSGATPIICGHFGLFFQMWSEGIFGNEVDGEGSVFSNRPHLTTAKAMMINSASQFDFEGENHDFSRTHQGWGRPDVVRLYEMRDKVMIIDETDVIAPFETRAYTVMVPEGETELRATMIFLDPAGNPAAAEARINDLSLRVTSPTGEVYWGNWGLRRYPVSVPGGRPNTVDPVENVWVGNPRAGIWQIEVIAEEINSDGHTETPELDADFALVVSGIQPHTAPLYFSLDTPPDMLPWYTEGQVTLTVQNGAETLDPTSPTLHLRRNGEAGFQTQGMDALGGGLFQAALPAMVCGESVTYYFSAETQTGTTVTWPRESPEIGYTTTVGSETDLVLETFEVAGGWTVGAPGDTATAGIWERGRPLSRNDQPAVDTTPGGLNCWFTQQEIDSNGTSITNDVDGGATTLVSPIYDLADGRELVVEFQLWYANNRAGAQDDAFRVEVSANGGSSWQPALSVGPTGLDTIGGWHRQAFDLAAVTAPTSQMRFRFIAEDRGATSRVEAALDDFRIYSAGCLTSCPDASRLREAWPRVDITTMIPCL